MKLGPQSGDVAHDLESVDAETRRLAAERSLTQPAAECP